MSPVENDAACPHRNLVTISVAANDPRYPGAMRDRTYCILCETDFEPVRSLTPAQHDPLAPLDELVEKWLADRAEYLNDMAATRYETGCAAALVRTADELQAIISTLRTSIEEERERYRRVAEEVDAVVERMMHEGWPPERLGPRLVRLQAIARAALSTTEAKDDREA